MRIPIPITLFVSLIAVAVVGVGGYLLLRPPVALLSDVQFDAAQISPNADGINDVTTIRYSLARNARVSIYLENEAGERYAFRQNEPRIKGDYSVLFSGVVDGYTRPDDPDIPGIIERRLIPNGHYTWTVEATNDDETRRVTGTLDIVDADVALPIISAFTINPAVFTPNQDGIDDRVQVNIYLEKDADLSVYLEDAAGQRYYLPEREGGRDAGEMGSHEYDYDGGVDQNMEPPPDGTYTVYAVAQDAEGQRIVRQGELTIQDGGLPQVEFTPQSTGAAVVFETAPYSDEYYWTAEKPGLAVAKPEGVSSERTTITMLQGDLLVFKVTVSNYGDTPIRTAGPFPGAVYQYDQRAPALGAYEEAGAWRVGIECDTSMDSFPWRWAIAPLDALEQVYDEEEGKTYYYLPPGGRAEVWGAIRMTDIIEAQNPQDCWAGLIHEQVEVRQERFGAREIKIVPPPEE